jgi:hypothetical protein
MIMGWTLSAKTIHGTWSRLARSKDSVNGMRLDAAMVLLASDKANDIAGQPLVLECAQTRLDRLLPLIIYASSNASWRDEI